MNIIFFNLTTLGNQLFGQCAKLRHQCAVALHDCGQGWRHLTRFEKRLTRCLCRRRRLDGEGRIAFLSPKLSEQYLTIEVVHAGWYVPELVFRQGILTILSTQCFRSRMFTPVHINWYFGFWFFCRGLDLYAYRGRLVYGPLASDRGGTTTNDTLWSIPGGFCDHQGPPGQSWGVGGRKHGKF